GYRKINTCSSWNGSRAHWIAAPSLCRNAEGPRVPQPCRTDPHGLCTDAGRGVAKDRHRCGHCSASVARSRALVQSHRQLATRRVTEEYSMRTRMITAAAGLVALSAVAQAQQPPCLPPTPVPDFANAVIRTTDLGNRIYMLEGVSGTVGGNVVVAVG